MSREGSMGSIPDDVYRSLTDIRVRDPDLPARMAARRRRRRLLSPDGRLALLAVDHTARMVTSAAGEPLRMADRRDMLSRTVRVLAGTAFDGILASPDVIDELFMLESMARGGLLDERVLIGTVNRGGLAGAEFELDDRTTGYDAKGIARMGLDGAKFLLRIDPSCRDSLATLDRCVALARECEELKLPLFLEPLPVTRAEGKVVLERSAEKLAQLVGVASALGSTSSRLWLKVPYVEGFERVARATTCPILLLGGEVRGGIEELFEEVERGLKASSNVRGVLMGRNILYPRGDDPRAIAVAMSSMVHQGADAKEAMRTLASERWREDAIFK